VSVCLCCAELCRCGCDWIERLILVYIMTHSERAMLTFGYNGISAHGVSSSDQNEAKYGSCCKRQYRCPYALHCQRPMILRNERFSFLCETGPNVASGSAMRCLVTAAGGGNGRLLPSLLPAAVALLVLAPFPAPDVSLFHTVLNESISLCLRRGVDRDASVRLAFKSSSRSLRAVLTALASCDRTV